MKKILLIALAVVTLCCLCINSAAVLYEYDGLYSVDLPESFVEMEEHNFIDDNNSNFRADIEDNEELNFCIRNLSDKDIKENADLLASEAKGAFEILGKDGEMKVVSCEKIKHSNGRWAVVTVFKTTVKENNKTASHLQKMYEFDGIKNKYTFIYTADKDEEIDSLDSSFDSIVIYESEAESIADKVIDRLALVGLCILLLIGIIRFIKGKRK